MHIDDQKYTRGDKKYRRVLLRNSYRVKGRVRHDTIATLSGCSDDEIEALKLALKHKGNLSELVDVQQDLQFSQGLSVGAVWLLAQTAKELGIQKALGNSREAKLGLWLVFATLIEQGSRLSATRLAKRHAACDVLRVDDGFNEDDLYSAMDWLESKQEIIEERLFRNHYGDQPPRFYLYDVTSSYFEGQQNELANYGYNRDKKGGKMQIVVGLMADDDGRPISIEVFQGNTSDTQTVSNQIKKMALRFGAKEVTLVGDRGMIKTRQIEELTSEPYRFNYISAITKPQIEKLIDEKVMQLDLFDEQLAEVENDGIRYVLHRNPFRAQEIADSRESKLDSLKKEIDKKNHYLAEHPRAKLSVAQEQIMERINRFKVKSWVTVTNKERTLTLEIDPEKREEAVKLDGCYAIKTDLCKSVISTDEVHRRYKGLSVVENAFRTMKTGLLELRPIFVRRADRTRAHVFIIMLAFLIEHQLRKDWREIDVTVAEGLMELGSICSVKVKVKKAVSYQTIPQPRELGAKLLKACGVILPTAISMNNAVVDTRKKLVSER